MLNNGWLVGAWLSLRKLTNREPEYKVLGNLEIECYVDAAAAHIVDLAFCIPIGISDPTTQCYKAFTV